MSERNPPLGVVAAVTEAINCGMGNAWTLYLRGGPLKDGNAPNFLRTPAGALPERLTADGRDFWSMRFWVSEPQFSPRKSEAWR
jgi:hypothetical protein